MVFSSTVFLFLFLPSLLLLYYFPLFGRNIKWRNAILLIFSIAFYAWGEPIFVYITLFSVLINWFLALVMEFSKNKKRWLILCIVYDVALLAVFKYATFISKNVAFWMHDSRILIEISLPIGISFFTFQMMSYVFDVYYGKVTAQKNPLYVALYVMLFPQLIAGPIVRYIDIDREIRIRSESIDDFSEGVKRFVYGLGKKVLIANFMGQIADSIFDATTSTSVVIAWIGALAYTLQIYFDFSGYSDMAIGLGRMFGFHFLENFNYPYMARSVSDFWKRWHISLTSWFRDYVYIPLGGNRVSKQRWLLNFLIVWLLTGIWHGANWTFLLWGGIYFVVLVLERITGIANKVGKFSRIYTMLVVIIAWVFFRSDTVLNGLLFVGNMFGIGATGFVSNNLGMLLSGTGVMFVISIIGVTPIIPNTFRKLEKNGILWAEPIWLMMVFCVSILEIVSSTYNPFIYFNF